AGNLHRPPLAFAGFETLRRIFRIGHVALGAPGGASRLRHFRREALRRLLISLEDKCDLGPLGGKRSYDASPDPSAASGHDRYLILQLHGAGFLLRRLRIENTSDRLVIEFTS